MARREEKQRAIEMRKTGMSYSQIKGVLGISKSTLSGWLADYPLTKERIRELRDCDQKIEKCRETKRKKKEARLSIFYNQEKEKIFPFGKKELYLAGLFLYWGEGAKSFLNGKLMVSNTDPAVIKFFMYWLKNSLGISKERIKVQLHLYSDMNIDKEINFWVETLKIDKKQFIRPYIKDSLHSGINHKGDFGHGTCNLGVSDARLFEKVLMGLKSISDYYIKE
jgi:predicted transcriptional regulator